MSVLAWLRRLARLSWDADRASIAAFQEARKALRP